MLIIFGGLFVIAIFQNIKNPPRDIEYEEVPEAVKNVVERLFPDFPRDQVRFAPVRKSYSLKGVYQGDKAEIDLELDKKGRLLEFEFEVEKYGSDSFSGNINNIEEIPELVMHLVFSMMDDRDVAPQFISGRNAKFGNAGDKGYRLEFEQANRSYEFKISSEGRLVELEIDWTY